MKTVQGLFKKIKTKKPKKKESPTRSPGQPQAASIESSKLGKTPTTIVPARGLCISAATRSDPVQSQWRADPEGLQKNHVLLDPDISELDEAQPSVGNPIRSDTSAASRIETTEPLYEGTEDHLPLASSPLWQEALQELKDDTDWKIYVDLVRKNASLLTKDVDTPDRITVIAQAVAGQIDSSKLKISIAGRAIVVRKILDKAVNVLVTLRDVGASATSLNPYAAVAWGSLQFFVQAAITHREVGALCWEELPRMVRLTSQYQTFEELYDFAELGCTGSQLKYAMLKLFSAILRYQLVIVKYSASRMDKFKTAFQDKARSLPQQVLDEISTCESEVAKLQSLADREITNSRLKSLSQLTETTAKQLNEEYNELQSSLLGCGRVLTGVDLRIRAISQYIDEQQHDQILAWVSAIKIGDAHHRREYNPLRGTGLWLREDDLYTRWRDSSSPSVLWLQGQMGSGKSCLAHMVVEDIRVTFSSMPGRRAAYFYCNLPALQMDRPVQTQDILRCFLQQLCRVEHGTELLIGLVEKYKDLHVIGNLPDVFCLELLQESINKFEMTVFVIDGLDECLAPVQQSTMRIIVSLLENSFQAVKIFISSQYTAFIRDLLPDDRTNIKVTDGNSQDIALVAKAMVDEAAEARGTRIFYKKGGEALKAHVAQEIVDKADGMFRWVQLAFEHLHRPPVLSGALLERLKELSHLGTLSDLYDAIYHNRTNGFTEPEKVALQTLLVLMLYGRSHQWPVSTDATQALSAAHVVEACSFAARCTGSSSDLDAEDLEALCPGLVFLTHASPGQNQFIFPHKSVEEWLRRRRSDEFSHLSGHANLAQLCMKVFMGGKQPNVSTIRNQEHVPPLINRLTYPTAFENYSFWGWLDHTASIISQSSSRMEIAEIWEQERELRQVLEEFLFTCHTDFPTHTSPSVRLTGLQIWHMVGQARATPTVDGDQEDDSSDDSDEDRSQDSIATFSDELTKSSDNHGRVLLTPDTINLRIYRTEDLPAKTKNLFVDLPISLITPAFICALLRYHCDLSQFEQAAFDISPAGERCNSSYDWQTRSLSAAMRSVHVEGLEWLIQQLKPTARRLAEALVLTFSLCEPMYAATTQMQSLVHSRMLQLSKVLRKSHVDLDTLCDTIERALITSLIDISRTRTATQNNDIAIMVASMIQERANAHTPTFFPIKTEHSDFETIFHWILHWKCNLAIEIVADTFLSGHWTRHDYTLWLFLAIENENCPSKLVENLLLCGADVLSANANGKLPLQVALESPCDPSIIDILSVATFAADKHIRTNVFDPDNDHFNTTVKPECLESTMNLWLHRGAQSVVNTDDRNGNNLDKKFENSKILFKISLSAPRNDLFDEWMQWLRPTPPDTASARTLQHELAEDWVKVHENVLDKVERIEVNSVFNATDAVNTPERTRENLMSKEDFARKIEEAISEGLDEHRRRERCTGSERLKMRGLPRVKGPEDVDTDADMYGDGDGVGEVNQQVRFKE